MNSFDSFPPILLSFFVIFSACNTKESVPVPPGFEIHPDFQLELVASEPFIFDPVDMEFDENGHAYVLEMPGYPLSDEQSRIILLEDENQDGLFDKRTVFADSLNVASSFVPYHGGMLVASPPHLLFLKDTNGDHIADTREELMEGFDVGNLQHNFNGLTYGLDNWIYAANGGNSGTPFFKNQPETKLSLRGEDFRFDLKNQKLERIGESAGGFEIAFDDWGRMYGTHNTRHISQLVFNGRYIDGLPVDPRHTMTNISDHEENNLSRVYPIGEQETRVNHPEQSGYFSGSCGATFYGGNDFPEGYNDHIFIADVVLNLIHLDLLSNRGSASKTSRNRAKAEFIASTDRAFRPVNMTSGPDGGLYIMDIHRDVIEHPEWIPDELEVNMDLAAGKEKGRIYRVTAKGKSIHSPPKLNRSNISGLVAALEDKNQWVRLTAQRLLVEKNDHQAISLLEELFAKTDQSLARLHIIWTLEGIGQLSDEILLRALKDEIAGVRENAIKIAESRIEKPQFVDELIALIKDETLRVSMQAALSLSLLPKGNDHSQKINEAIAKLLSNPEIDTWITMAAAAAVKHQPIGFMNQLFTENPKKLNANQKKVTLTLARLIGKKQDYANAKLLLESLAKREEQETIVDILRALSNANWELKLSSPEFQNLLGTLKKIEKGNQVSVILATGKLRKAMRLPASAQLKTQFDLAFKAVVDKSLIANDRLNWLQLLALEKFANREVLLYQLLDNRQPVILQKEALQQLWESNDQKVGKKLLSLWPSLGPEARKQAGNIFLYREGNHDLLLSALESGTINMGELNLDLERRRVLLFSDNETVKSRAEILFSDAGVVQRKEAIENMRPAIELAGISANGKNHFLTLCSSCHQYGASGKLVGPVLTEIRRKSKESLLHDILDPNAAVDTRYVNHNVKTKDGKIYQGIVDNESDTEISLRMMGGEEVTIAKKDIENLSSLGISMMPEGLEGGLSPQDMADLLAYLQNGE